MVLNNFRTMRKIIEIRDSTSNSRLIFDVQRSVTEGALDDASAAGRYSTS